MKRTIKYVKDKDKYIFKEENTDNYIEIDVTEKILSGLDLYNNFFKNYNKDDEFELINCTTEDDNKSDKICNGIFQKVKELFETIDKQMKSQIFDDEKENEEKVEN